MKKAMIMATAALSAAAVYSAGFGLYEASARGNALGGALIGSTRDATAVYYNPANMTECTNVSVTVGATMVWLYSDVSVDGRSERNMNPGLFCIPNAYLTVPVWGDLYFGLGIYCENGLGTRYGEYWSLAGDTVKTTMEQFTLNPALAYKITDWWSFGAGMKMSYITFFNRKHPNWGAPGYDLTGELDGDDIALGYDLGTSFRLFENETLGRLKAGLVYRSQIRHEIEGDFDMWGRVGGVPYQALCAKLGGAWHSDASAQLNLPQSVAMGLNWDSPEDRWHLGAAAIWTEWSSVDTITFDIPGRNPATGRSYSYKLPLQWDDVWRFSVSCEYDAMEDLSVRCGYVYDIDPSSSEHGTTMLPGGDRHIIGLGFGYRLWSTLRLDVGYNLVMMDEGSRGITVNGVKHDFETENAFSHMLSVSLSYAF